MVRNNRRNRWILVIVVVAAIAGITAWAERSAKRGPAMQVAKAIAAYPHDPRAFTQGLAFDRGQMYEGTGQYGFSSIRRVEPTTGIVKQISMLNRAYFGEGITILDGKLYQLTWQSHVGAVYDPDTFKVLQTFSYEGEGWGLANDGEQLILSDGTATLRFLDPQSFEVLRRVEVLDGEQPIERLNELEYVRGEIWANIWYEDRIARISPETGHVLGWIDVSGLYPPSRRGKEEVANGIAYDPESQKLFLTGKDWPQLFQVEIVDAPRE